MPKTYIAFYGSLMAGFGRLPNLGFEKSLRLVGPCQIRGQLVDLGAYPGLIPGSGTVEAELYEVVDDGVLERLDAFEGYDPRDPMGSLYLRKQIRLANPPQDAWVFVYNRSVKGRPVVEAGSWERYLRLRNQSRATR